MFKLSQMLAGSECWTQIRWTCRLSSQEFPFFSSAFSPSAGASAEVIPEQTALSLSFAPSLPPSCPFSLSLSASRWATVQSPQCEPESERASEQRRHGRLSPQQLLALLLEALDEALVFQERYAGLIDSSLFLCRREGGVGRWVGGGGAAGGGRGGGDRR